MDHTWYADKIDYVPIHTNDDWAAWQQVLTEPWPILADAACIAARIAGLETHITPGRWTL